MKTSKEATTFEHLTSRGLSTTPGKDSLDVYLQEIGWNMRSLMRQADMLDTAILEMKKDLPEHAAVESSAKRSA